MNPRREPDAPQSSAEPGWIQLAAAWLLGVAAMVAVQAGSAGLAGNDSYYHLKMARLLPEMGFVQRFPWLHWTIFRDQFVSHHYGFHVLLAPLVWISERITGDPVWAGKAAVCLSVGMTAALFRALLQLRRVAHGFWWVLLLCCLPWHFWLRMSYLRAPIVALPLLLLTTWLVIRRRTFAVALLAFVFTHVYGGAVLIPIVPLAFVVGGMLAGESTRLYALCLAASAVGVLAGLICNPYFPHNLAFLRTQLFETGLGAAPDIGSEWKPFNSWFLFQQCLPLALLWFLSLCRRLRRAERADAVELGMLVLQLAFLVLTLKARRFIEYWPVFALVNAAYLGRWSFVPQMSEEGLLRTRTRHFRSAGQWAVVFLIGAVAIVTLRQTRSNIDTGHDHDAIRSAMVYLQEVTQPGALVFTDDWDVFPTLFYYNHRNYYVVGLDPVFTRHRYPLLWERYKLITRGQTPKRLPRGVTGGRGKRATLDDIADEFGARFVFVAADHPKFYEKLCERPDRFTFIYPPREQRVGNQQPAAALFQVLGTSSSSHE